MVYKIMSFTIKKDPRKIQIMGTGSGWELAPVETDYLIYALNDFIKVERYGIKPDVLFMMDILEEKPQILEGFDKMETVVKRVNDMKIPFIAPYKYQDIPLSEPFPIHECVKRFGYPYFTNTICYMIAYALMVGAKEISLYGINQAGSHEYHEERGGVEHWLGIAKGMNVVQGWPKVTINGRGSQLLKFKARHGNRSILYGYSQTYEDLVKTQQAFGEGVIRLLEPNPREVKYLDSARLVSPKKPIVNLK